MPKVDKLYAWLANEPTPNAERIIAAALPQADDASFARLVDLLLGRANESSWAALISQFSRLTPEQQDRILIEPRLVRAGITAAARWSSSEARENAFRVLNLHPDEKLAFLVPTGLRDSSQIVRTLATDALRQMADAFLQRHVAPIRGIPWEDNVEPDTELFLEVIRRVFAKFTFHLQVEAFEIALWFARYFEDEVWESLDSPRSHTAYVTREHLFEWKSPHLTGFLMLCMERREWRRTAAARLEKYTSRDECCALLRNTDLLQDEEIAHAISLVRKPLWYDAFLRNWGDLPAALQQHIPAWLVHSSAEDEADKLELLTRLATTTDADGRVEAIFALAEIDSREAEKALARIAATGRDALAHFASWVLQGRRMPLGELANQERAAADRRARLDRFGNAPPKAYQQRSTWQMLQRAQIDSEFDAMNAVMNDIDTWCGELARQLSDNDPHERLTALRFVESTGLACELSEQIKALLDDHVPGVRARAMEIMHAQLFGGAEVGA